jgi:hypothetical protein
MNNFPANTIAFNYLPYLKIFQTWILVDPPQDRSIVETKWLIWKSTNLMDPWHITKHDMLLTNSPKTKALIILKLFHKLYIWLYYEFYLQLPLSTTIIYIKLM